MWSFARYVAFASGGMLALTVVFTAFAAALSYYLRHLKRFLGR